MGATSTDLVRRAGPCRINDILIGHQARRKNGQQHPRLVATPWNVLRMSAYQVILCTGVLDSAAAGVIWKSRRRVDAPFHGIALTRLVPGPDSPRVDRLCLATPAFLELNHIGETEDQ